ncbi:MAG: hypothetical protein FWH14_06760 [Oscillospiraceae bacterium]|nr:hypothetical protein [Oscillospiraceae bacterium]
MNKEIDAYEIDLHGKQFNADMKHLVKKKKFNQLPSQIKSLKNDLEKGKFDGDRITHKELPTPHDVYKIRLPNPDTNSGKSNGYRVIYFVVTEKKIVVLLTIYYKKEQEDVDEIYINGLIDGYFMGGLPPEETE